MAPAAPCYASPDAFNEARARYAAEIEAAVGSKLLPCFAEHIGAAGGFLAESFGDLDEAHRQAVMSCHAASPALAAYLRHVKAAQAPARGGKEAA